MVRICEEDLNSKLKDCDCFYYDNGCCLEKYDCKVPNIIKLSVPYFNSEENCCFKLDNFVMKLSFGGGDFNKAKEGLSKCFGYNCNTISSLSECTWTGELELNNFCLTNKKKFLSYLSIFKFSCLNYGSVVCRERGDCESNPTCNFVFKYTSSGWIYLQGSYSKPLQCLCFDDPNLNLFFFGDNCVSFADVGLSGAEGENVTNSSFIAFLNYKSTGDPLIFPPVNTSVLVGCKLKPINPDDVFSEDKLVIFFNIPDIGFSLIDFINGITVQDIIKICGRTEVEDPPGSGNIKVISYYFRIDDPINRKFKLFIYDLRKFFDFVKNCSNSFYEKLTEEECKDFVYKIVGSQDCCDPSKIAKKCVECCAERQAQSPSEEGDEERFKNFITNIDLKINYDFISCIPNYSIACFDNLPEVINLKRVANDGQFKNLLDKLIKQNKNGLSNLMCDFSKNSKLLKDLLPNDDQKSCLYLSDPIVIPHDCDSYNFLKNLEQNVVDHYQFNESTGEIEVVPKSLQSCPPQLTGVNFLNLWISLEIKFSGEILITFYFTSTDNVLILLVGKKENVFSDCKELNNLGTISFFLSSGDLICLNGINKNQQKIPEDIQIEITLTFIKDKDLILCDKKVKNLDPIILDLDCKPCQRYRRGFTELVLKSVWNGFNFDYFCEVHKFLKENSFDGSLVLLNPDLIVLPPKGCVRCDNLPAYKSYLVTFNNFNSSYEIIYGLGVDRFSGRDMNFFVRIMGLEILNNLPIKLNLDLRTKQHFIYFNEITILLHLQEILRFYPPPSITEQIFTDRIVETEIKIEYIGDGLSMIFMPKIDHVYGVYDLNDRKAYHCDEKYDRHYFDFGETTEVPCHLEFIVQYDTSNRCSFNTASLSKSDILSKFKFNCFSSYYFWVVTDYFFPNAPPLNLCSPVGENMFLQQMTHLEYMISDINPTGTLIPLERFEECE